MGENPLNDGSIGRRVRKRTRENHFIATNKIEILITKTIEEKVIFLDRTKKSPS